MTRKLTEMQRTVLLSTNDLDFVVRPAGLKPSQAAKMTAVLVEAGLAKEIRAKAGCPVWREDDTGQRFALKVLKAGQTIVATQGETPETSVSANHLNDAKLRDPASGSSPAQHGTKQSAIVALMERPQGASTAELIAATGWLPHTTRAALTGLRKKGITIARSPAEQGSGSVYRIAAAA